MLGDDLANLRNLVWQIYIDNLDVLEVWKFWELRSILGTRPDLMDLAEQGIAELISAQRAALVE